MTVNTAPNEDEQVRQTIEMFEVIVDSNPDDYESLTLLKEQYAKIHRGDEVARVSLLLGKAYLRMGQNHAAVNEFQSILEASPDHAEAQQLFNEASNRAKDEPADSSMHTIDIDMSGVGDEADTAQSPASLMEIDTTEEEFASSSKVAIDVPEIDGNPYMVQFLLENHLAPPEIINSAAAHVAEANQAFNPNVVSASVLQEVSRQLTSDEKDNVYLAILEATQYGFIPLGSYQVDRQVAKMLPNEITLGRRITPFEIISRTIMIATCNPFDLPGKQNVESSLDYNIQWFFSPPEGMESALIATHKLST